MRALSMLVLLCLTGQLHRTIGDAGVTFFTATLGTRP